MHSRVINLFIFLFNGHSGAPSLLSAIVAQQGIVSPESGQEESGTATTVAAATAGTGSTGEGIAASTMLLLQSQQVKN